MSIWSSGSRGPSVAGDPRGRERRAGGDVIGLRSALLAPGPAGHRAGAAVAGAAAAMLLLGALGAPADGAAGVRPAVPLVRRARGGRSGVGREHVQQEPRPAAGGRGGAALPGGTAGAAGGAAAEFMPMYPLSAAAVIAILVGFAPGSVALCTARAEGRLPSSPGRASTRAINDRAAAGSRPEPPGGSSHTSTSTWATIQASCASLGRFFNSLLESEQGGCATAARALQRVDGAVACQSARDRDP